MLFPNITFYLPFSSFQHRHYFITFIVFFNLFSISPKQRTVIFVPIKAEIMKGFADFLQLILKGTSFNISFHKSPEKPYQTGRMQMQKKTNISDNVLFEAD